MRKLGRRIARMLRAKILFSEQLPFERESDPSRAPAHSTETSQEDRWLDTLELARGTTHAEDQVRAAYLRLSKRFHPDRFASTPEKLELANELMQEINRAYRGLLAKKQL